MSDAPVIAEKFVELAEQLTWDCVDVLPAGDLARRLAEADESGKPLRIKLGMDPTSADVHLGHAVALQVMRRFQDAGHTVVLIIGDYTALVGDPTGRSKSRPVVTLAEIEANAQTYQDQAFLILDPDKTEVRWNSEWLAKLSPLQMFDLMRKATVAQVLEREDFAKRYSEQTPISLLETLYPLLQGYDSVAIDADIEFGGTDQLFNNLMGRHLMPQYDMRPQGVIVVPLLTGTDGVEKMSKSLDNYVGLTHSPDEMFGRTMSIPDTSMAIWYELAAGLPRKVAREYVEGIRSGGTHPNRAKRTLARHVVERFHSADEANAAEERFDAVFQRQEVPDDVPRLTLSELPTTESGDVSLVQIMVQHMGVASNGEAKRLIKQGGVKIGETPVASDEFTVAADRVIGSTVRVGKRRFLRIEK